MNFVDTFSLMLHAKVSEKMLSDEVKVLQKAKENLERWLKSESFVGSEKNALLEWKEILEKSSPEEIRKIITQDNDEGQRLRSSSPFAGVLGEEEREIIWSKCAKIRPV